MRKLLSLAIVLLLGVSTLFAQAHLVKGRILDGDGKPVDGATVRVKKGTAVTAADAQGNFKIEAKAGDVLVISAVNFGTKEVRLGNETDVAVTLSRQSSQLDEVVVTAMGIKRSRNALPYAAQEVGGDEVSKTRNSNFVDGLSGKVAGLQITQPTALGASTNVVLRGIKSISQSNQALFVVDGVPFDNTSSASGAGQTAKICNNMLLGILMIGTSEALALGVANGLDPKVLSEIMRRSSGGNWALEKYNPMPGVMETAPASKNYAGGFGTDLMLKDLGLAQENATAVRAATPLGGLARSLYAAHSLAGHGALDFSSVLKLVQKAS